MRVRDLRLEEDLTGHINDEWDVSQKLRCVRTHRILVVCEHVDNRGVFDISIVDEDGRLMGDYMTQLDKFELACAISGMAPVT